MIDFHKPSIEDRNWAEPILRKSGGVGSEYAFGTHFTWQNTYHAEIAEYRGFLVGRSCGAYMYPIGCGDRKEIIEVLMQDAKEKGYQFWMYSVPKEHLEQLEKQFPGVFTFREDRENADYVYRQSDLANLPGKKYHSKRNHVSKFRRLYGEPVYEELSRVNLAECMEIAQLWYSRNETVSEEKEDGDELDALRRGFDQWEALHFRGGLIRVNGKAVAFSIGEAINESVFVIHFEKALTEYEGIYAVINQEFARNSLGDYEWIDREEDMGIEGLRKAKNSYHPAYLAEVFDAVMKEER